MGINGMIPPKKGFFIWGSPNIIVHLVIRVGFTWRSPSKPPSRWIICPSVMQAQPARLKPVAKGGSQVLS